MCPFPGNRECSLPDDSSCNHGSVSEDVACLARSHSPESRGGNFLPSALLVHLPGRLTARPPGFESGLPKHNDISFEDCIPVQNHVTIETASGEVSHSCWTARSEIGWWEHRVARFCLRTPFDQGGMSFKLILFGENSLRRVVSESGQSLALPRLCSSRTAVRKTPVSKTGTAVYRSITAAPHEYYGATGSSCARTPQGDAPLLILFKNR